MSQVPLAGSASVEIDGARLRETRQDCGFTQLMLAERTGLSAQYISQLELGQRTHMKPPTFKTLCEALDLPPSQRRILRKQPQQQAA